MQSRSLRRLRKAAALGLSALLLCLSLSPPAMAAPFRDVWGMDQGHLRGETEGSLCEALAAARWRSLDFAPLNGEISRRGLDCSAMVRQVMGECEPLTLLGREVIPGQGTIFTVRNASSHSVVFHVTYAGVASSHFEVAANSTQRVGVRASQGLSMLGGMANKNNPDANNVIFFDCRIGRGW